MLYRPAALASDFDCLLRRKAGAIEDSDGGLDTIPPPEASPQCPSRIRRGLLEDQCRRFGNVG